MRLVRVINGVRVPYSEQQLRNDNPSMLLPRGLVGVDLSQFGVEIDPDPAPDEADVRTERVRVTVRTVPPEPYMVPMHCFLWGLRSAIPFWVAINVGQNNRMQRFKLLDLLFKEETWNTSTISFCSSLNRVDCLFD